MEILGCLDRSCRKQHSQEYEHIPTSHWPVFFNLAQLQRPLRSHKHKQVGFYTFGGSSVTRGLLDSDSGQTQAYTESSNHASCHSFSTCSWSEGQLGNVLMGRVSLHLLGWKPARWQCLRGCVAIGAVGANPLKTFLHLSFQKSIDCTRLEASLTLLFKFILLIYFSLITNLLSCMKKSQRSCFSPSHWASNICGTPHTRCLNRCLSSTDNPSSFSAN